MARADQQQHQASSPILLIPDRLPEPLHSLQRCDKCNDFDGVLIATKDKVYNEDQLEKNKDAPNPLIPSPIDGVVIPRMTDNER